MDQLIEAPWYAHTRRDKHRSMLKDPLLVRKAQKRVADKVMRKRRTHKRLQSVLEDAPWEEQTPPSPVCIDDWLVIATSAPPTTLFGRLVSAVYKRMVCWF